MSIAQTNTTHINNLEAKVADLEARIDAIIYSQTIVEYTLHTIETER